MDKILIIENDKMIAELERDYLEASGFDVEITENGREGCRLLLEKHYDAAILEVMLPEKNGFMICREVRKEKNLPILFVTSQNDEVDRIRGLGLGADDYLSKPFSPSELIARLKAHIQIHRRLLQNTEQTPSHLIFGNLKILPKERRVYLDEQEVMLVNKEYELLLFLAENPNIAFSRDTLLDRVWGFDAIGNTATVTVHINRLRDKMKRNAACTPFIDTLWGVGYRFCVKN